ncbi:MAG: amidohydrolase family protein, partial [Candidatus Aminicenantaceae bacterium]
IESHTSMGTGSRYSGSDMDETSAPNTAQLSVIDAVNPFDKNFQYVAKAGITTLMLSQGRTNVIGGQTAVVKVKGKTITEMKLQSPAGVKISLGETPKTFYGQKEKLPSTRMGSAYVLRKALMDAQHYLDEWGKYWKSEKDEPDKMPKRDLQLEPLAKLLQQELIAFIECYRADDIMTALRIVDEFNLRAVLVGCAEGYKIPDEIARRNIPVIISPFGVGPRRMETKALTRSSAAILHQAGVKVAIKADESLGIGSIRELPLLAALAVKGGLDRETALRAITLNAAEILDIADRVGSLEPGKDADLVLFDGDPLNYRTRVKQVFIDGEPLI